MPGTRMTVDEKILSYLRNRKGLPVSASDVATGARIKVGTVTPQLAKLTRKGKVYRVDRHEKRSPNGRPLAVFVHADCYTPDRCGEIIRPSERIRYADLVTCADYLEAVANAVITRCTNGRALSVEILGDVTKARDMYRDLKHRGIRPKDTATARAG